MNNTQDSVLISATEENKTDNDDFTKWFNQYCDLDTEAVLIPEEAWNSYKQHYTFYGIADIRLSVNKFKARLQKRLKAKTTAHRVNGKVIRGIKGASLHDNPKLKHEIKQSPTKMTVYTKSPQLKCRFSSWDVIDDITLALYLAQDNCCDMTGCIQIATKIMPKVKQIITYSGSNLDTRYVRIDKTDLLFHTSFFFLQNQYWIAY
jgi:hypothetical protein